MYLLRIRPGRAVSKCAAGAAPYTGADPLRLLEQGADQDRTRIGLGKTIQLLLELRCAFRLGGFPQLDRLPHMRHHMTR